jgi:hypothetical protein
VDDVRGIAALMTFEATTLIVASVLHLSGAVDGEEPPFDPSRAGIAETLIAVVLIVGALALNCRRKTLAVGTVAFAIAGFGVGLSMTALGGASGDIAYHATMLPILAITLIQLARLNPTAWT